MAHISIKHNYFIITSLYYRKEQKNVDDDQGENGCVILPSLNGVTGTLQRTWKKVCSIGLKLGWWHLHPTVKHYPER